MPESPTSAAFETEPPEAEVLQAIAELLRIDAELLIRDVAERAVTARLAEHLRPLFHGWDIDCEYNREGHKVKRADGEIVVPDIIVHKRGEPDNHLVIEVKKSSTREPDQSDIDKLAVMKAELNYRYALFLKLTVGASPGIRVFQWV